MDTPDFIPADSMPDFIPAGDHHQEDFTPIRGLPPQEEQSSAAMRFIKSAASKLYGGTLGAGPQQSTAMSYGTPEWQQMEADARAGKGKGVIQTIKDSLSGASPVNINVGQTISSINPVAVDQFQSGDVAGGMGSTLANLLMLRQAFKGNKLPVGGAANTSEIVGSLTGGKPVLPQKLLPAAPIELPASSATPQTIEGVLPAARRITPSGKVQYLTRPLNPGESPAVPKDVNTQSQAAFIDALQQRFNMQTETESPFQIANRRMAETAKTPFDRATPKAPAVTSSAAQGGHAGNTVSSVEELSRPGTNYVVTKGGALTYHGKSFAPESTPSGATHVTALPDGSLRVNAGPSLNPAQEMALRSALPKPAAKALTGQDLIQALRSMAAQRGR